MRCDCPPFDCAGEINAYLQGQHEAGDRLVRQFLPLVNGIEQRILGGTRRRRVGGRSPSGTRRDEWDAIYPKPKFERRLDRASDLARDCWPRVSRRENIMQNDSLPLGEQGWEAMKKLLLAEHQREVEEWGGVNEFMIARYLSGLANDKERELIEHSRAANPLVSECLAILRESPAVLPPPKAATIGLSTLLRRPVPAWCLAAACLLLALLFIVPAILRGGNRTDAEALARVQMELEKLKADIEQKKNEVDRQEAVEASERQRAEDWKREMRDRDEKMRREQMELMRSVSDQNKRSEMEAKFNAQQQRFEEEKRAMEMKQQQDLADEKRRLEESKRALDAATAKQQTIVQQAPPVIHYAPYHYRYYWPWGW